MKTYTSSHNASLNKYGSLTVSFASDLIPEYLQTSEPEPGIITVSTIQDKEILDQLKRIEDKLDKLIKLLEDK